MDVRLDGRVAVVTGAGRGLGRSHALQLAARGACVVVNDSGAGLDGTNCSPGPAEGVVEEIIAAGGRAVPDTNDISSTHSAAGVIQTALDSFGRIDVLVNNAGIVRDGMFHKLDATAIDQVIGIHLQAAFHLTQVAWRHMRVEGYGRVVNTTSASGLLGSVGQSNYAAAKMGLVGLTKVLALEGEQCGIMVNAIAPMARTRMTEDHLTRLKDRLDPESVSPLVVLLASDECPATGGVFSVAAGRVAEFFVGLTSGIVDGISPEDLRSRWPEVRGRRNHLEPVDAGDEMRLLAERLLARIRRVDAVAPDYTP